MGEVRRGRITAASWLADRRRLDELPSGNLISYTTAQQEVAGTLSTDQNILVARLRGALGDWRVCVLSPLGSPVTARWAMAISAMLEPQAGHPLNAFWTDDGIIRRPTDQEAPPARADLLPDPEGVRRFDPERRANDADGFHDRFFCWGIWERASSPCEWRVMSCRCAMGFIGVDARFECTWARRRVGSP